MSYASAVEIGRLYKPIQQLAARGADHYSKYLLLPGLRCFWAMSSVAANGVIPDQSGNGVDISPHGTPTINYGSNSPYLSLNGSTDYFDKTDSSNVDLLGTESYIDASLRGATIGGWFFFNDNTTNPLISKWTSTGNQRSYHMERTTGGIIRFFISPTGSTSVYADSAATDTSKWYFAVGRFTPSTAVDVFVNAVKTTQATTESSIYNSTATLYLGYQAVSAVYLAGRMAQAFMCAAALPDALIDDLFQATRDQFSV